MTYFWLGIVIFLGFIEAITVQLVSIWFVISALVALTISLIIDNFVLEFASFVIIGIILLLTTRTTLEKKLVKKEKTNFDRVIGMKGIVTDDITELKIGEVKVDGKIWSAVSKENLKVGDKVSKGQVLGIVEAMKLMNEIESEFDGTVKEILVENEQMVEFGQPMFVIE